MDRALAQPREWVCEWKAGKGRRALWAERCRYMDGMTIGAVAAEGAGRLAAAGCAGGVHSGTAAAGGGCAGTRCARCGTRCGGGESTGRHRRSKRGRERGERQGSTGGRTGGEGCEAIRGRGVEAVPGGTGPDERGVGERALGGHRPAVPCDVRGTGRRGMPAKHRTSHQTMAAGYSKRGTTRRGGGRCGGGRVGTRARARAYGRGEAR